MIVVVNLVVVIIFIAYTHDHVSTIYEANSILLFQEGGV